MEYKRPYCSACKLIWGRQSIGRVLRCTTCGGPLILKSFNPWPQALGGAAIIGIAVLTITVQESSLIWIGGFLFGGSLIINGFHQWGKILDLDRNPQVYHPRESRPQQPADRDAVIFICGQCSTKISVRKGTGYTTIVCPGCGAKRRVSA